MALVGAWFGGGAVLGMAPRVIREPNGGPGSPFALLDTVPVVDAVPNVDADHPGVYGGWFGFLGYQTGALIERLPAPPTLPIMPSWWLGWFDEVVRFDPGSGWWFEALVDASEPDPQAATAAAFERWSRRLAMPAANNSAPPAFTPFRAIPDGRGHLAAVERVLAHIRAGDIYQANVCLRLAAQLLSGSAVDVFTTGLAATDARYAAYLAFDDHRSVASLSPELFLQRRDDRVLTMPIKGTRRRSDGNESGPGEAAVTDLASAPKDRAENVMIVDLMRNDLGRVCAPGSITVPRLFDVEAHPGVWHLVSSVEGQLEPGVADGGLMRATMPPGSVTGAPKVRAMELIAEVEATAREVYTGAIGGISPVAGAEWNVAIRTFEIAGSDIWLGVGGGIVADSDPLDELAECATKAAPLIKAIGATLDIDSISADRENLSSERL